MLNHLIKKKIIRIVSNQQIRGFKREVVSSDFDLNFHKDKQKNKKLNNKNDSIKYYTKQIKKNQYDIENEKWLDETNNVFDRED